MIFVFMIYHQKISFAVKIFHIDMVEFAFFNLIFYRNFRNAGQTFAINQDAFYRFRMAQFQKNIELVYFIFDIVQKDFPCPGPLFSQYPFLFCQLIYIAALLNFGLALTTQSSSTPIFSLMTSGSKTNPSTKPTSIAPS